MKRLFRTGKIVVFIVGLIAIHVVLREAYYAFITPQNSYLTRQKEFTSHKGPYDVVLFGDSHALISVQPKLLGNVANMSQLGEGYIVRYYKLRYNLRKNPGKIETIILPLDLHSFSPVWGEDFHEVSSARYVNFADYLWHSGFSIGALKNFAHYYLFPYADCSEEIYDVVPSRKKEVMEQNLERLERSLADTPASQEAIKWLMNAHYGEKRQWFSEKSLLYFNRVKALCQKHNIRVIFVRFPVSEQYVEDASKIVPIDEFDKFTQGLVDDWPGAVLLDYRELYFGRDDLFFDLNHLNGKGSTLFSKRFRSDLNTLDALPAETETAAR